MNLPIPVLYYTIYAQIKRSIEEKLTVLNHLDEEILEIVDEGAVTDDIEQSDLFKEGILTAIEHCISTIPRDPTATAAAATAAAAAVPLVADPGSRVKLPKLTIQPYSGDLVDWTSFWDSFEASIHKSTSLSEIEKFSYLKSLLRGPALEAI